VGYNILDGGEGEADRILAIHFSRGGGGGVSRSYEAILARDTDFLVYAGVRYIPFYDVWFIVEAETDKRTITVSD